MKTLLTRLLRWARKQDFQTGDLVLVYESKLKNEHMSNTPWLARLGHKQGDAWIASVADGPAKYRLTPRKKAIIKNPGDPVYLDTPLDRLVLWEARA